MKKISFLVIYVLLLSNLSINAQVGVGTTSPTLALDVEANGTSDGVQINNVAGNGDPILQYQVNGTSRITMGIDDSDADKFKIGTTAITTNTRLTIESAGNIGIRTTTPGNMLHMTNGGTNVGATNMSLFENLSVSGVALGARNNNTNSGYNAIEGITDYNGTGFIPAGVFGLAIYNGANLSPTIGVRGASNEWQGTGVRGSRYNSGGANTGWGGEFYDDLGYTGFFGTISDKKAKKDIQRINDALSIIQQLNPVTYKYDLEKYPNMGLNTEKEFGFVSQEVKEVIPEVTREKTLATNATTFAKSNQPLENKSELFLTMDYTRIIPILTQGIKEQQQIIELQDDKINSLENRIIDLEIKVNRLIEN